MLGKASEINTKSIYESKQLGIEINKWLQENPDVTVIDIKFTTITINDGDIDSSASEALIIYKV